LGCHLGARAALAVFNLLFWRPTMESSSLRPLAIVTGASSGIGYYLAMCAAEAGHDLILAADEPLEAAAAEARRMGVQVETVQTELASRDGVDALCAAANGRPIALLMANAGHGLGGAFLTQDFKDAQHVIDTNVTGTIYLLQKAAKEMVVQGQGRILITGSIAGFQPGSFQAVYNGTKAFVDSFAAALRNELKDTGVTVTCLMPGPTDTEFFARAGMLDTKVGSDEGAKADPADVAKIGFKAMMDGEADVVAGLKNKMQVIMSKVMPSQVVAEQHRKIAEPQH
jgi:short-subunit dehydrogenase